MSGPAESTPREPQTDTLTPIERLNEGDREDVAQHVTPSIERALTLFENLTDWGSKAGVGYTLRPADSPKTLLEAARDESLSWSQYYRAAEALESLSKGAVTFFKHNDHGKMIALHEDSDVHDRVTTDTARSHSVAVSD